MLTFNRNSSCTLLHRKLEVLVLYSIIWCVHYSTKSMLYIHFFRIIFHISNFVCASKKAFALFCLVFPLLTWSHFNARNILLNIFYFWNSNPLRNHFFKLLRKCFKSFSGIMRVVLSINPFECNSAEKKYLIKSREASMTLNALHLSSFNFNK